MVRVGLRAVADYGSEIFWTKVGTKAQKDTFANRL